MAAEPGQEVELQPPSDAITALSFHPSDPDRLLASSWDGTVRLYSCSQPGNHRTFNPSRGPVFDVTWGEGSKIYSGGLDKSVVETDVETSTYRVIGNHNDAVRCVKYLPSANCLVSASWDSTLRIHDPRTSTPANSSSSAILTLPSKAFSMDAAGDKLVVAMGQRHVYIYDVRNLTAAIAAPAGPTTEPYQKRENSLKFMTRSVRCMPNGTGYANSSIEGRVAVEYFDQDAAVQKNHFAFKCHRATVDGVDTVYPVNALAFHPVHGTFATGGGDALVSLWDPVAKKRLRQLPKYPASISALSFNADGSRLAVACAVLEEETGSAPAGSRNALLVRGVGDDAKPKAKA